MGAGYSNGFALLVVLFILLIIVGAKISLLIKSLLQRGAVLPCVRAVLF